MDEITKVAKDFVLACEAIQALIARGELLAAADRDLIEFSALDLLHIVKLA
jgi:hypothetical protein